MKQAGYETYFTGKWHIRTDANAAFDVARHVRPGMPAQTEAGYDRPKAGEPDPWDPVRPRLRRLLGGRHALERGHGRRRDRLPRRGRGTATHPSSCTLPSTPRTTPGSRRKRTSSRYPLDRVAVPADFLPEYPYKDAIGCGPGLRDERLAPFPRTEHAVKVHRREYYALITHLDAQIGRILDALDASGKAGETIVAFTADHGLAIGHHGLLGKQNLYEPSVRVPFVVAGPGIAADRTIDAPIYLQDIMPTTLEWAGVDVPEYVGFQPRSGRSGGRPDAPVRASIYGAYLQLQRSVTRDG